MSPSASSIPERTAHTAGSRLRIAAPFVVPLLIAAALVVEHLPRPRRVTLTLTGPKGQTVAGTYTVNGVSKLYTATLPAKLEAKASRFAYALWSKAGVTGTLTVDGRELGTSATRHSGIAITGVSEFSGYLIPIKWTQISTLTEPGFERALQTGKL